ncbi:chromosome segregation protein SMC [Rhodobacteraceae bacterium 2CG4]|uniref:Chromosome partition protein Smc n=1 Tax=Halovulum marinum TaxID=2662447 RepID=A0A6L5YW67_9RHOB|nr:chromosome segregation protein SMC [Halovulum marinum]MSU88603.1 chromosome segregation protein SMC [Halovulum marinum]
MQFTKLRLLGFKSFVDPTELHIAPGLTGVVGPNGCGKSNLLEALRWVMGENRPTAMRGGGMEDVIFAGAASRPARNYAEVTLHLDNTDRLAPAGFNDQDNLEIVRRITRDAGSAYKTNGKEARARDVQMLFADASTGAHSPALVRQGQISELINAKPKARRRILEEAAGISGLYQRRHEAELKLKGTETNLARVEDVLEALRAQLGALEKQVRQARRYREISAALRVAEGMLLYRRWQEAEAERAAAAAALTAAVTLAGRAQTEAARAAAAREQADAAVPPLREEEAVANAVMQRQLVARDQLDEREARAREEVRKTRAQIEQLTRDAEREQGLNRDANERITELDWEKAAIEKASAGQDAALDAAEGHARATAAALKAQEAGLDQLTEDTARLAARHQSAERRVADAESQARRMAGELQDAEAAEQRLRGELDAAAGARAAAEDRLEAAQEQAARAEDMLAEAEADRADAQAGEAAARGARAEADGAVSALGAEVSALRRLLEREKGEGPQVLDSVRADPGFEAALGAALGDDLKAPEVDGDGRSGWRLVAAGDAAGDSAGLPDGAAPLAGHVEAPAVLARRLAHVGLVAREDGPRLQARLAPGQRLVSREGDLWRWDGYSVRAEDAPSTAALRLQQQNRLRALQAQLDEAEARAGTARAAHDDARAALEAAQAAEAAARRARKEAEAAWSQAQRAAGQAESAETTLQGRLETVAHARARRAEDLAEAEEAIAEAHAARDGLEDLDSARATLEDRRTAVEGARATMLEARQALDDLRREIDQRKARAQSVAKELSGWRARLETAESRSLDLAARIEAHAEALEEAQAVPERILEERARLVELITGAEDRCRAAADALAAGETALREAEAAERAAERAASEAREGRARAEALAEAAAGRVEAAAERIAEEQDKTPETLLEALDATPDAMPDSEALEIEAARLARQRDALGAVNLRAEEDAAEVRTEFETLAAEKADLEEAVGKLRTGIANLNREGRHRLLAAFEEVNANFSTLFRTLFGGGDANLVLVESEDPLDAGLEIMCQPPGKKLSTLSLLSGGEQTLTAMSLIFAVFLANPSPICVLDEVDAPLDDANVTRFCDLLDEMTRRTRTRFLIITHHAVTMSRMDRLFGVTMAEQGVSQLVSVDLARAEALVDA